MNEYTFNLMEQFANASGINISDFESDFFRKEFAVWLELNKSNLNKFYTFLKSNGQFSSRDNILEVGHGYHDSLLINYGFEGTVITPDTKDLQLNEYINIIVSDAFTSLAFNETQLLDSNLSCAIFNSNTVISCNLLNDSIIPSFDYLNRFCKKNVLLGAYGNVSDVNAAVKKEKLKQMQLYSNGDFVYKEITDANTYCAYVTTSDAKIR